MHSLGYCLAVSPWYWIPPNSYSVNLLLLHEDRLILIWSKSSLPTSTIFFCPLCAYRDRIRDLNLLLLFLTQSIDNYQMLFKELSSRSASFWLVKGEKRISINLKDRAGVAGILEHLNATWNSSYFLLKQCDQVGKALEFLEQWVISCRLVSNKV